MEKIEIKLEEGVKTLTVREGEALPLQEPRLIDIIGSIESPSRWVSNKKPPSDICNVKVDKDAATIALIIDEHNYYATSIIGKLLEGPDTKRLKLNKDEFWSLPALAKFIQMNLAIFEDKAVARELVSTFKSYKAKINQEVEKADDDRANKTSIFQQTVESNVPESFVVNIPVYKGMQRQKIKVDVLMEAQGNDVITYLISPELKLLEDELKEDLLQKEIKIFEDNNIVVIDI